MAGHGIRNREKISWICKDGGPSCQAVLEPLSSINDILNGSRKANGKDLIFRNPDYFVAGELHHHSDTWNRILEGYHKRDEVLGFIHSKVSVFDFMVPFKGDFKGKRYDSERPPSLELPNSKTCNDHEEFINQSILERVCNGSLSVWGKKGERPPPFLVMPITIEPSKPRMCHDERFLNLWMKAPPVKLDPITDLPRYVGKDHFQTKLDDKSGYDHIELTEESKPYFGLQWQNWYFVYNTLPFGWSPSAYVYQTVGLGASHFIRSSGVPISQYIDDRHIGQFSPKVKPDQEWNNIELAEAGLFICALVLVHCGYFVGLKKSALEPTQRIVYLGLISDSVCQAFRLPEEKKEKFSALRESLLKSSYASLNSLQRFAGKIASFSLAVPAARLFSREIYEGISKGIKRIKPVKISGDMRTEIEHWRFLDSWNGHLPGKDEKHKRIALCSDASNTGWGGILFSPDGSTRSVARDYWSDDEATSTIAVREAKALHNTLIAFSNSVCNTRVDAEVDNTNLLHFWNNEGGRNRDLVKEMKSLFFLCLKLNVTLSLSYTPSGKMAADTPSRFSSDIDCRLSEKAWQNVESLFGPHTFDLMAIPSNVRKDRSGAELKFFSPHPCPNSAGVNIFAQSLGSEENYYIFPPFILIGPLLRFLKDSPIRVTFLAFDVSPRKFWWPLINSYAADSCLLGKKGQDDIIFFPPSKKLGGWHTRPLPWDLHAFRLVF